MIHLSRCLLAAWLAGGLFQAASAQLVVPAGASMDLGGGALDLACQPMDISGSYSLSGGSVLKASKLQVEASGILNVQGLLEVGGDFINAGQVIANAGSISLNGACLQAPPSKSPAPALSPISPSVPTADKVLRFSPVPTSPSPSS